MNAPLLRQLFVVSSSLLAAISTGGVLGLPSILVQQLKRNDSSILIDVDTESWIASVHGFAGAPSIFVPYMMQRWGRRLGFRACCIAVLIGCIMLCFSNSAITIIISEIFQGVGVKSLFLSCMIITSEMVEPRIRNQSLVLYGAFQTFLVFFVHTAGNFVHWKIVSLLMSFPLALTIIFSFIWPETPAWLAYKGRFEESKKSFIWLRGKKKESLEEMNTLFSVQKTFLRAQISTRISDRSEPLLKNIWRKISSRDFYLPIFHMFVLQTCYYWSGNLLIVVYAINIIGKVIKNSESAFIAMIVIDIAFVIGNLSSPILLKFYDNKPILLTGGAISVLCLLAISTVLYLQKIKTVADDSTICLYFIVGFMVFSSASLYMIPFGVATEIIPLRHKGVSGSIYIVFMSISYTCSLKLAPYIVMQVDMHGLFFIYAIILTFCFAWIWKYVPETRNRTLQSIEEHYIGNSNEPDMAIVNEELHEIVKLNTLD